MKGTIATAVIQARKAAAKRANQKKAKAVSDPVALVLSLTDTVVRNIELKRAYLNLCLFFAFAAVYLSVLFLQRATTLSYRMENTHKETLFTLATKTLQTDSGDVEFNIASVENFYEWFESNVLDTAFTDPQCGDGVCSAPTEFPSFGRFGCSADCGTYNETNLITVTLEVDFSEDLKEDNYQDTVTFNLCSETYDICMLDAGSPYTLAGTKGNFTTDIALPDGDWVLELDASKGQVGGKVEMTNSTGSVVVLQEWERCGPPGSPLVPTSRRLLTEVTPVAPATRLTTLPIRIQRQLQPGGDGPPAEDDDGGDPPAGDDDGGAPPAGDDDGGDPPAGDDDGGPPAGDDDGGEDGGGPPTGGEGPGDGSGSPPADDDTGFDDDSTVTAEFDLAFVLDNTVTCDFLDVESFSPPEVNQVKALLVEKFNDAGLRGLVFAGFEISSMVCTDAVGSGGGGGRRRLQEDGPTVTVGIYADEVDFSTASSIPIALEDGFSGGGDFVGLATVTSLEGASAVVLDGIVCDPSCATCSSPAATSCFTCFSGMDILGGRCVDEQLVCPELCEPGFGDFATNDECDEQCYREACDYDRGACCPIISLGREFYSFPIWTYNTVGVRPTDVFPRQTGATQRNVGLSNTIIAGVLVNQQRKQSSFCPMAGKFHDLYETCQSDDMSTEAYGIDPVFLSTSSLYNTRYTPSDTYNASELDEAGIPFGFFHHASPSSAKDDGFPVFFDVNLGSSRAKQLLQYLQDGFYIDHKTHLVTVQLVTFNGHNGMVTRTEVTFEFDTGGTIFMFQQVQSLLIEVYGTSSVTPIPDDTDDVGSAHWAPDNRTLRAMLEVCCVIMVAVQIVIFFYTAYRVKSDGGGLMSHFFSFWTILDIVHFSLLVTAIIMWIDFWVNHASQFEPRPRYEVPNDRVFSNNDDSQPRMLQVNEPAFDEALDMFARMRDMTILRSNYFAINGIVVITLILRMLNFLDFQPRMGLVTRTISRASADIAHFLVLFCLVMIGYAIVGHLMLGSSLRQFSTLGLSLVSCMEILLGDIDLNDDMMREKNLLGPVLFFWSFIAVVFLILLNILLAILIESYLEVKRTAEEANTMLEDLSALASQSKDGIKKPMLSVTLKDVHTSRVVKFAYLTDVELMEELYGWSMADKHGRRALRLLGLLAFTSKGDSHLPLNVQSSAKYFAKPASADETQPKDSSEAKREPEQDPKATVEREPQPNPTAPPANSARVGPAPPDSPPRPESQSSLYIPPGSRDFFHTLARAAGYIPPGESSDSAVHQAELGTVPPLTGWTPRELSIFANFTHRFGVYQVDKSSPSLGL